jgi:lysyl endopeptidase
LLTNGFFRLNLAKKVKRIFFSIIILLLFVAEHLSGQVSAGGTPLEIPRLKSLVVRKEIMPVVDNHKLYEEATRKQSEEVWLKSLQFARGFDVNISPETSGFWTKNIEGYDVWQVKISSAGAYSLSLIFDKFHLQSRARLFISGEKSGQIIGAFTSANNKTFGRFATAPVAGDEITVQYEVPAGMNGNHDFVISQVNHDFVGILKSKDRRPTGKEAGDCNIDINCPEGKCRSNERDAVCRIITTKNKSGVTKSEICTGMLINNTAENEKPYVLTAAHCISMAQYAETSVFVFNYESPFCSPLDGDPGNSVSGSKLLAISDSLDFALVELTLVPPPDYRPYFAGWDRRHILPDSTYSIHHPQGDIKKIAIDRDPPTISFYRKDFIKDGFLKITKWEKGTTEGGSSGSPLFSNANRFVGSLTGGSASCQNPVNDYYSRFEMAWEYKPDSSKQLKCWLDPLSTNAKTLDGKRFYTGENLCLPFTNLEPFDTHQNVHIKTNRRFAGYWGGTNSKGITEFAERFSIQGNKSIWGISIGAGKIQIPPNSSSQKLKVNVYSGNDAPDNLIHSETVNISSMAPDAMNFIGFTEKVEPDDTFFVAFELLNMQPQDTFVVYQSLRQPEKENFFWFKQNGSWYDFKSQNEEKHSMSNVFELVLCNVSPIVNDTPLVISPAEVIIYPNPVQKTFIFEAGQPAKPENIRVYNLIGQPVNPILTAKGEKKVQIDLSGHVPGVYIVRFNTGSKVISKKVSYMPQ